LQESYNGAIWKSNNKRALIAGEQLVYFIQQQSRNRRIKQRKLTGREKSGKAEMNNQQTTPLLPDTYDIWDYSAPAKTRERFTELLPQAKQSGDVSYLLQLQTQIARTYSLQQKFDSAHAILDGVEAKLTEELTLVRICYLLERGRTFNSAGDNPKAVKLFTEAYTLSAKSQEDFYAVDSAHMVAIATSEATEKEKWNLIGIAIAEKSKSKRARNWLGSLYNNLGWDYFDQQRYPEALQKFEQALEYQKERGDTGRINIARWCVAKGYRSLDRIDEALVIQEALLKEYEQSGTSDGYVFEELAELYLLKGDTSKSQQFFAKAFKELSKDTWLVNNQSERLQRLKTLGSSENNTSR
jgi:tetratricopeptide (TPR) repeat protein